MMDFSKYAYDPVYEYDPDIERIIADGESAELRIAIASERCKRNGIFKSCKQCKFSAIDKRHSALYNEKLIICTKDNENFALNINFDGNFVPLQEWGALKDYACYAPFTCEKRKFTDYAFIDKVIKSIFSTSRKIKIYFPEAEILSAEAKSFIAERRAEDDEKDKVWGYFERRASGEKKMDVIGRSPKENDFYRSRLRKFAAEYEDELLVIKDEISLLKKQLFRQIAKEKNEDQNLCLSCQHRVENGDKYSRAKNLAQEKFLCIGAVLRQKNGRIARCKNSAHCKHYEKIKEKTT